MRWFKLTVETFERTTNPPNGSFVVMTRKEGPAGGRSGGGVYEMAPESAALISLRLGGREGGRQGGRIFSLSYHHSFSYSALITSSLLFTPNHSFLLPFALPQLRLGPGGRLA